MERITKADLVWATERISRLLPNVTLVLEGSSGKWQVYYKDNPDDPGQSILSPLLPKRELWEWLNVFEKGVYWGRGTKW